MSAGRTSEGAGCVAWWGFSPARDLLSSGPVGHRGEANVLLVGSADPRHILKTIAGLGADDVLHVWLVETSMEVVARQLLLLYIALIPQESMGLNEKTEVFLEVFGNSEIRSQTDEVLKRAAAQLLLSVTDTPEAVTHPCLNTCHLKFKERDELAAVFQSWIQPSSLTRSSPVLMSKVWDYRVRQHLGTRYDSKTGCFDWDLTMKLHERGGRVISKQQYARWRERGVAFEIRDGVYQTTNPSLLSSRVFRQKGDKVAARGYWGDIVSSPYLSFGIETEDKNLLKTQNGRHTKTAQDISFANVQELFHSLSSRRRCATPSQTPNLPANTDHKPTQDLMHLDGVSVHFLPADAVRKLPEKPKYFHLFNAVYVSASCVHHLGLTTIQIAAPDAVLHVELARFILDLNAEQETGFAETVGRICAEAGFEPCPGVKRDGVHAAFVPQKKHSCRKESHEIQ